MIPKLIHYCWFGNKKKDEEQNRYIDGWKQLHPSYTFMEWNEGNFDISYHPYTREAYRMKKWAFVTDYVRLYALLHYGGIYLDTDVEVLKPLDPFLTHKGFAGFEARDSVATAIIGAEKGNELLRSFMTDYEGRHFIRPNDSFDCTTNVILFSNRLIKMGMTPNGKRQTVSGFELYPQTYFCPNSFGMVFDRNPRKAYTIHHCFGSWTDRERPGHGAWHYLGGRLRNALGTERYARLRGI